MQATSELKGILEKIATELIFAEPGKDLGLLPLNCLLAQVEELMTQPSAPRPMIPAVQQARKWVNDIFGSTGTFDESALKQFGEWVVWCQAALQAFENRTAEPVWPPKEKIVGAKVAPATPPVSPQPLPNPADTAIILNVQQDGELLREFINESQEHLQNIEQGVLVLEDNPSDADTLNSIFRAFHTFKGGSGFLNLTAIQTLAHDLESLLDLARQHKLIITHPIINLILESKDLLKNALGEIEAQLSDQKPLVPIVVPAADLLESIRAILDGKNSVSTAVAPEEVPVQPIPTASNTPAQILMPLIQPKSVAPRGTQPEVVSRTHASGAAVKVDTLKLDSLIDLVGELVVAQSLVVQNRDLEGLHSEQLTRDLTQLGRISKELQRTAMSLRMVPIRATFQKMNRLVRDSANKVGKEVVLITEGEETELDRNIVEEISDPLIHMIRNSIDHGIEKSDVRKALGKPPQGKVTLKAFHQGGNIVVQIHDDGQGLNRDRIIAKAVEQGLMKSGEQLPDSEVFQFILAAGFSTAEKVTDLSGRGVGMDVVRRNIEKLRGKIEITSVPGKGSTFSIFLPLTLAIIDGLLVGVGNERFILPTLSVCESFRPTAEMISTVHGRGEMVNVRGRLRPLLRLYLHFGIQPASTDPARSIVVVIEAGTSARCVLVDQLLGKQEIVIKSLEENFRQNRFVAGAAILGDGRVGLILDPEALVNLEAPPLGAAA